MFYLVFNVNKKNIIEVYMYYIVFIRYLLLKRYFSWNLKCKNNFDFEL